MLIVKIHVALLRSCPRVSPRWFSPAYATKAGFEVPRGAAKEAVSTSSTPPPPQRSGVQEGKQTGTERGKEGGKRGMSQRGFGGAGRGGASGSCTAVLFLNRRIRRYACGLRMCLPKCYLHFFWEVRGNKKQERDIRSSKWKHSKVLSFISNNVLKQTLPAAAVGKTQQKHVDVSATRHVTFTSGVVSATRWLNVHSAMRRPV